MNLRGPAEHTAEDATPGELRRSVLILLLMLAALGLLVAPLLADLPLLGKSTRTAIFAWLLVGLALYWMYAGMGYRPLLLVQLLLLSTAAALLSVKLLLVAVTIDSLTVLRWMARYLMLRLTESYGIDIEFHCKPLGDTDWTGSGMHANFSTKYMREVGGKEYFEKLMKAFEQNLQDHIAVYGPDNDKRLTGKHETAPWNKFSFGVADRGASIRVPHSFVNNGFKGYLEDRRPNSQGDPYQIASQILKTISTVPTSVAKAA